MKSSAVSLLLYLTAASGAANFWRLPCKSRTIAARIDPIMAPGEPNSHLHTVFGSGGFSSNVTQDELLQSDCTSCAVTQDRSVYWTPPLMFMFPNGSTRMVNQDGGMLVYYFVYGYDPQPFPRGFRMVAGNQYLRNFTGPVPDPPTSEWTPDLKSQFSLAQKALGFNCLHYNKGANEDSLFRHTLPNKRFIDENCPDGLRLELMFPSCWNGVDVDSPDHRAHVAYPDLVKDGVCPQGFETRLISLFYETKYDTQDFKGVDGSFVLASGDPTGCGYHGDFLQGWQPDFLRQAMHECSNPSGEVADCPLFTLQNDDEASACQIAVPKELSHEDPSFNSYGLLGQVPIQHGPAPAAPYGVELLGLVDHDQSVATRGMGSLQEGFTNADTVARAFKSVVPSESLPKSGKISFIPLDRSGATKCNDRKTLFETVTVVDLGVRFSSVSSVSTRSAAPSHASGHATATGVGKPGGHWHQAHHQH